MSTTDFAAQATKETPSSVAGRALGVAASRLAAVSTRLNRPAVAAVGAALVAVLDDDRHRLLASGTTKGVPVWAIAETAAGEVVVPTSAMVLVPAGVVCGH